MAAFYNKASGWQDDKSVAEDIETTFATSALYQTKFLITVIFLTNEWYDDISAAALGIVSWGDHLRHNTKPHSSTTTYYVSH